LQSQNPQFTTNEKGSPAVDTKVFRVDKFSVPPPARAEFLEKVHATHLLLRSQAGFVQEAILEQASGPAEFNFVTIVEWENAAAMEPARQAVAALHKRMNLDPHELFVRLGIRADLGNYKRADASTAQAASADAGAQN
jgi:heme-degrading monooxygenase HmoA